jgi:hypothetical protein
MSSRETRGKIGYRVSFPTAQPKSYKRQTVVSIYLLKIIIYRRHALDLRKYNTVVSFSEHLHQNFPEHLHNVVNATCDATKAWHVPMDGAK